MNKNPQVNMVTQKISGTKRGRMRDMEARHRKGTGQDPGVTMTGRLNPKMSLRQVDKAKKMSEPDWDQVILDDLYVAEKAATHRMSGGEWAKWAPIRARIKAAINKQEMELKKKSQ